MKGRKIIVAMTGASGAGYCLELLKALSPLRGQGLEVDLLVNESALSILEEETGASADDLSGLAGSVTHSSEMDHALASGSNLFSSMVICPCSTSTACKVHAGIADNLTARCASVALKERRQLILVIRETPLSTPVLKALYELSSWGVVIMPASPPFYGQREGDVASLHKALAGRVLDLLGLENDLSPRYSPGTGDPLDL